MTGPQLAIIADDLTGAADTAGGLASRGLSVALCLDRHPVLAVDVVSLSADTRDAPRDDVPEKISAAIGRARHCGEPSSWYHKVDSAFRGHPGLEVALISTLLKQPNVLICPALPSQGRAVIHGRILVNRILLHETALGEGKRTSSMSQLLGGDVVGKITNVGLSTVRQGGSDLVKEIRAGFPGVVIVDADSELDLRSVADALTDLPGVLPVGSAGLAAAMGKRLTPKHQPLLIPETEGPSRPVLLVVGSAHEASHLQVQIAGRGGMPVIRPLHVESEWSATECAELSGQVRDAVSSGRDAIVTYAGCEKSPLDPQLLARQLASVVAGPIRLGLVGGLVLTGGDIAAAVCEAIDAGYIWLRGEVAPAVPWGVIGEGPARGTPVVTKAGSFGAPTILCDSIRLLRDVS